MQRGAVKLQSMLNHRLSLNLIAPATFGMERTAEGLQAIRWFKDGCHAQSAGGTSHALPKSLLNAAISP
jgi:hypothetical protein